MATWHQARAGNNRPIPATDGTWSVFTDPPYEPCATMAGFSSRKEAEEYLDRLAEHHPVQAMYSKIVAPVEKREEETK